MNITREPAGKSAPPPSTTTPAPSLPRISGAFARGNWPERIVCSRGVTPTAVIRSLPETTVKVHRSNMMRKIKAASLAELCRMVDKLKMLPENSDEPS